eukprot:Phypoly_transcript_05197.p1 GENE.Phypoly_transcript_05197~~Phypoly_transcript_05197.p1  ORF type:complete len:577 (+),score=165.53 Phypoly_transcript_05197:201-1733(+)
MEQDEARQEGIRQSPLSDNYTSGSASKKRKMQLAAQNTKPETLFVSRMQEALKASGQNNPPGEADLLANSGPLPDLYLKMLSQNLAIRLQNDPDFDPARFPNAAALFTNSRNAQSTTTTSTATNQNNNNNNNNDNNNNINTNNNTNNNNNNNNNYSNNNNSNSNNNNTTNNNNDANNNNNTNTINTNNNNADYNNNNTNDTNTNDTQNLNDTESIQTSLYSKRGRGKKAAGGGRRGGKNKGADSSSPTTSQSTNPDEERDHTTPSKRRKENSRQNSVNNLAMVPVETPSTPVDKNDVILSLAFYHQSRPLKTQEYLVLGSQPLTVLRDRLYCLSDYIFQNVQARKPSGYFFFETTFYADMRDDEALDYAQTVIDWAAGNPRFLQPEAGPLRKEIMHETTFNDLSLRIGAPYLYVHQGDCQHIITITDMRLINKSDNQNRNAYPLQTFQTKIRRRKCRVCDIYPAKCITIGDKLSPENPCFYCDLCYHPLHYTEDNQLLYDDYLVFPYFHE